MTELLVTLVFMALFTNMILVANRMLASVASDSIANSQQQTLANTITSAMLIEMRNAKNISLFTGNNANGTGSYYDGTTTHTDTAGFVYDSSKFDFLQSNAERTYRELIYVDKDSYKLYVGRAPNEYSLSTTIQGESNNYNEAAKELIGLALYKDNIVKLNNNQSGVDYKATKVLSPSLVNITDVTQHAQFQLSFYIEDTRTSIAYFQDMIIYTNIST